MEQNFTIKITPYFRGGKADHSRDRASTEVGLPSDPGVVCRNGSAQLTHECRTRTIKSTTCIGSAKIYLAFRPEAVAQEYTAVYAGCIQGQRNAMRIENPRAVELYVARNSGSSKIHTAVDSSTPHIQSARSNRISDDCVACVSTSRYDATKDHEEQHPDQTDWGVIGQSQS
jgi:hypothetical protein